MSYQLNPKKRTNCFVVPRDNVNYPKSSTGIFMRELMLGIKQVPFSLYQWRSFIENHTPTY